MSEHITHIAVYEDCARIIKNSGNKFTKAFHEALETAYDSGLICCGSRGNHIYAIPILETNREIYGTNKYGPKEAEQVAGAIGWLAHRASDLQMKPMFKKVDELGNQMLTADESQMYHDAVTYKNVYKGGKISTNSKYELVDESTLSYRMHANPAAKNLNIDHFEDLMAHNYVAQILGNCVFTNELKNINEFAEKIVEYSNDLYEDLRMYVRAYENPVPFKMQGYINNFNIYDPADDLIQFVRYVQENNTTHQKINLQEALGKAENQSKYAQALKMGYDFVSALSDFFDKKISKEETIKLCQI